MKWLLGSVLVLSICFSPLTLEAKDKRKVQKLNFEEENVDGKVRQPDGSYIVQKRGIDFIPLYKLRENFDDQVEQSIEYLK